MLPWSPASTSKSNFSFVRWVKLIIYSIDLFFVNFRFPAHRLILIASSKYFKVFLGPKFPEGAANEIVVEDIDASTLKSILDFIYFGRIEITEGNVGNLIAAASSMELLVLGKRCGECWKTILSIENCVEVLLSADKYRLEDLWSNAVEFICEHFETVSIDDVMRIDKKNLQEVLKRDEIKAAETVVFDRLVQWMNKNVPKGEKVGSNLLKSIRLGHIPTAVSNGDQKFRSVLSMKIVKS